MSFLFSEFRYVYNIYLDISTFGLKFKWGGNNFSYFMVVIFVTAKLIELENYTWIHEYPLSTVIIDSTHWIGQKVSQLTPPARYYDLIP